MLPVAASLFTVAARSGDSPTPAAGASAAAHVREEHIMSTKMLAAMTALTGKAVATEDEGVTALTALQAELPALRSYAKDVAAEIGETDPAKAVSKVKELKAAVSSHELSAKAAKEKEIAAVVEATMKTHEKKLTVPMRALMARQLTGELAAGTKVDETETVKALSTMPELGITSRATGADDGSSSANTDDDVKLDAKAKELMSSNAEVKALNDKHGFSVAFPRALSLAREQLGIPAKQKA
jgi:hypothetical protein